MNEPAFPATEIDGGTDGVGCKDGVWHYTGMTLRDYFAAKALQGFASTLTGTAPVLFDVLSRDAYLMADAMLKARGE